ncbi:MAG TPA: MBL fold metallo-hydrolase [Rhizomicrobium sp.]|jgi:ribonuclease Z|nr:MBL fold metallo-hydrolase [Rhizomicrobium sp.]
MQRFLFVVAPIAIVVLVAWGLLQSPAVDTWIYTQAAKRAVSGTDAKLSSPGELSVLLCGTGSPLPDKSRASACTLIAAGGHLYLIDAGLDSARNLLLWHVPLNKVDGILITHFHSDHIAELGELRLQTWVAGRKVPLPVYGPPGIEQVVAGFNQAYSLDADYRTAHHGAAMLPLDAVAMVPKVVTMNADGTAPVLSRDGLTITAIRVNHGPVKPSYGYRFDYAGRSIVVSGDTAPTDNLVKASKGADVLVHEALSPELVGILGNAMTAAGRTRPAKIMHDIPSYHTSPVAAARIANQAHVRLLVYTHLIPVLPDAIAERAFLRGVSDVRPDGVVLGHDGLIVRLPGHSDRIEQDDLN